MAKQVKKAQLLNTKGILKCLQDAKKSGEFFMWQKRGEFEYFGTQTWCVKVWSTAGMLAGKTDIRDFLVGRFGQVVEHDQRLIINETAATVNNPDFAHVFSNLQGMQCRDAHVTDIVFGGNYTIVRCKGIKQQEHYNAYNPQFLTMTDYKIGTHYGINQPIVFGAEGGEQLLILAQYPVSGKMWDEILGEQLGRPWVVAGL